MFWLCCGPRPRKETKAVVSPEPDEHSWLLEGEPPISYNNDIDESARTEQETLRDIVRETENKMVNITDPHPFLFQNASTPTHTPEYNNASSEPSPTPPNTSPTATTVTPRGPSAPPPTRAHTPTYNRNGNRSTRGRDRSHSTSYSGTSSSNQSFVSNSSYMSGEDYDDDYDEGHLGLQRGPILNVRIVPVPGKSRPGIGRASPIAEAEEPQGEEAQTNGVASGLKPEGGTDVPSVTVQPLPKADYDAIMALSSTLWNSLEHGFWVTEPPRVVRSWD